jgi:hypothetical protein
VCPGKEKEPRTISRSMATPDKRFKFTFSLPRSSDPVLLQSTGLRQRGTPVLAAAKGVNHGWHLWFQIEVLYDQSELFARRHCEQQVDSTCWSIVGEGKDITSPSGSNWSRMLSWNMSAERTSIAYREDNVVGRFDSLSRTAHQCCCPQYLAFPFG